MKKRAFVGLMLLLIASFFWGSTFVAQSDAAERLPSFTYLAARSYVGAAALFCALSVRWAIGKRGGKPLSILRHGAASGKRALRRALVGGCACGAALMAASILQQEGIVQSAGAGEAGFLTAIYMFFVPLFARLCFRKKIPVRLIPGALLMMIGLYFLCIIEEGWSSFGPGHFLVLGCAVVFAVHVLLIDRFGDVDGMVLSFVQFTACALLSTVGALIFDRVTFAGILDAWFPIVYAGVCSSAIAYTLQIYGQQMVSAALATIVMSLESVIALISEWACCKTGIFVSETPIRMTPWKIIGCVLCFAGILLAQLGADGEEKADKQTDAV